MYRVTDLGHNRAMCEDVSPRMIMILDLIDREINEFSAAETVLINRALDDGLIIEV
jgi:hypothetical protein